MMKKSATVIGIIVSWMLMSQVIYAQPLNERPRNSPYEEKLEQERKIIPYDHLRESDVFWETRIWRVIDCREKMNLPFVYPKEPLIEILLNAMEKEGLPAYSSVDDEFTNQVTASEVLDQLNTRDTIYSVSPYTGRDTIYFIVNDFDPLNVQKFKIQEVWIIDEETSTMYPRIMGFAPVRDVFDPNTGEFRGVQDMFWIYYPDARQILANNYAFNPNNDAVRMSWEDIFEMRLFNSYIVKQTNVYDRAIESYATGVDAVLESNRIKMEIFKKEHELWSF